MAETPDKLLSGHAPCPLTSQVTIDGFYVYHSLAFVCHPSITHNSQATGDTLLNFM